MTWNFSYTIPSFIVLLFISIFYFLKPVILTQSNRVFVSFILIEIFGFFITVVSSYADNNANNYSNTILTILNSTYYLAYIARYYTISIFFGSLLNIKLKKNIPTIITTLLITTVTILILINPWAQQIYRLSAEGKYIKADNYLLIYYANFITLILDIYYIIRVIKKLTTKQIVSSVFTVVTLFACCFMDILYVNYLITDMFFLFVILIIFLAFENPDNYVDKKTGLFNYTAFAHLVQEHLFKNQKFSVITFIVKNYPEKKQIYGVKQTDLLLKEIGKFFLCNFPAKKCFYLLNGKFGIIDNNAKDFHFFSKTVKTRFEQPWIINNSEIHLNMFIVDTDNNINFNSLEDIYASYGIAYEESKKTLGNHITINQKLFDEIIRKTKVTKALNKALLDDDLEIYLQPIVDSSTKKIIAAEALVRIYDDDLGLIPPAEFISMAEKNGSIEQLGEQVLNKVCIFLKESNVKKRGIKWINVNLSPIQCQNHKLPEKIDTITKINTIDHKFIHLEITEDAMIDTQILKNQMDILITDGYKFDLDDFGSGFSNVSRVKSFPFSNIKLDMGIVWDHFNSPDDMLPSIIKTFNDRGLSVTAEGVESKEMADSLTKMGCSYLQGYYFSKPIPINDFVNLIRNQDK